METTISADAINLGAALEVIRDFLDQVGVNPVVHDDPKYVAARCVIERLIEQKFGLYLKMGTGRNPANGGSDEDGLGPPLL